MGKTNINETLIETFEEILRKNDKKEAALWLKSLTNEREIIRKEMIKIHKANRVYRTNSTMREAYIVAYVHFYCFRKEDVDYLRMMWRDLPEFKEMEELLDESVPEGFPELFGSFLISRYLNRDLYGHSQVSYTDIMRWVRKKYVHAIEPYIAMRMDEIFPRSINTEIENAKDYIDEKLAEYPEILEEQIHYLFRYPNEVSYSDRLGKLKVGKAGPWAYILKNYTLNGKLDRMYLLRECLVALGYNYKKDQLNWFVDLFVEMEPTTEELLALQDDLLPVLALPLTKAVGMALNIFKQIAAEKTFRKADFLLQVPVLLVSDTKAIVLATLNVLEKLASKDKNCHEDVCLHVASAFLSKEEAIQTRAANLIVKYGGSFSDKVVLTLQPYEGTMLNAAKQILSGLLSAGQITTAEVAIETKPTAFPKHITDRNKIDYVVNTDDLIFGLTSAFNQFDPLAFYLIPDMLHRLCKETDEEVLIKMEPAIQSAYKLIINFNPNKSYHQKLTAFFFLKYVQHLLTVFPKESKGLKKLHTTYDTQWEYIDRWWNAPEATGDSYLAHEGFRRLTLYYLEKLTSGDLLPILSVPTHYPTWIDPVVLIERLKIYQTSGVVPNSTDLQQALQLCSLENSKDVLSIIERELEGELKDLFCWYFDTGLSLPANRQHNDWWLTAAIANPDRKVPEELYGDIKPDFIPYLENRFQWEPYIKEVVAYIEKDPVTGEDKPFIRQDSLIRFNKVERLYTKEAQNLNLFIGFSYLQYPWAADFWGNIRQIMLSSPNNWQSYLMKLANETIQYASDTVGKHMTMVLDIYSKVMAKACDMDYMYLSLCFLQKDKTLRAYLGDIWAEMTEAGLLDNVKLGEVLGRFLAIEYAPPKRTIDTFQDYMIKRSSFLDDELKQLIGACLAQIGERPIAGSKKIQSIHKELS